MRCCMKTNLLENVRLQFELLGDLSNMLYLGRDSKATLQQHPDLTNQSDKPVTV